MTTVSRPAPLFSGFAPGALNRDLLPELSPGDIKTLDGIRSIAHLLELGQSICGQTQECTQRLCLEVEKTMQGNAHLHLGRQTRSPHQLLGAASLLSFPVQFNHIVYGYLTLVRDSQQPDQPVIPTPIAQLLIRVCGWLLYTFEQAAFVQGQCRQLQYQVNGPLTKREREVLTLMCQGHDQQAIADILCIAPATVGKHRQHIYNQLGVHCERDALFAAYHTGLFSLIEGYSS
ncbi:response regulator transcription factor [Tengunoibacter tsumagoiensis]|uniref:HTH luxR-type domain-containing protein n=1 Tax=Tengunoibacter tsumagoiensis TaxID=2014871 RepID=A0A402A9N3_9CHLR|nr:helix-turn-helix transcriptional regulator [Tengunoibacter tsumagoiensis]GCE15665.1 hypothetical protein KTT_55240 [Tengunoibacter tsumagoiensis]